jgi:hypothetical protein
MITKDLENFERCFMVSLLFAVALSGVLCLIVL